MSEGFQAYISQFSRRKARNALSTAGSSYALMDAVFLGSVGCTWNLMISSVGLKEVDFDRLARITSSVSTFDRRVVSSSVARASDNASKLKDVVLFSARSALSGSLINVITPLGLSF